LVQAAMALWRTNGYAKTTVADICRAAGVSRALFYFYFPAKEDVLFEVGLLSTRAAQKTVHQNLAGDYDVHTVIAQALRSPRALDGPQPARPDRRDDPRGLPPGEAHPHR
jgi:AcrR family transcriptional regulator